MFPQFRCSLFRSPLFTGIKVCFIGHDVKNGPTNHVTGTVCLPDRYIILFICFWYLIIGCLLYLLRVALLYIWGQIYFNFFVLQQAPRHPQSSLTIFNRYLFKLFVKWVVINNLILKFNKTESLLFLASRIFASWKQNAFDFVIAEEVYQILLLNIFRQILQVNSFVGRAQLEKINLTFYCALIIKYNL